MSNNAKHYDYYKVEGPAVKELIAGYEAINQQRRDIIKQAEEKVGAVAHTLNSGFGEKGDLLVGFAWDKNHAFPCPMTIKNEHSYGDRRVVVGRGKGNTKEGREYNKLLDTVKAEANAKLSSLPCWETYIISHYGVMRTGFGEPASRGWGISMLTTYGGRCPGRDDCLLFAIPNSKAKEPGEVKHGSVEIPPEFQKLTYGQFFDITNETDAEDDE